MTIWQRLATQTLEGTGKLEVTIAKMRWLKVEVYVKGFSPADCSMQFGVDDGAIITSGGKYATTVSIDGATDTYKEDENHIRVNQSAGDTSGQAMDCWATINIENQSGVWKFMNIEALQCNGPDSDDVVHRNFNNGVLNETGQITKIKMDGNLGNHLAGSSITVYGADDTGTGTAYPDLPNGATFLTSDTNKLYMFDGTDTWNLVS